MAKRKWLNCLNNDMRLTIAFSVISTELISSNALFTDLSFTNSFHRLLWIPKELWCLCLRQSYSVYVILCVATSLVGPVTQSVQHKCCGRSERFVTTGRSPLSWWAGAEASGLVAAAVAPPPRSEITASRLPPRGHEAASPSELDPLSRAPLRSLAALSECADSSLSLTHSGCEGTWI